MMIKKLFIYSLYFYLGYFSQKLIAQQTPIANPNQNLKNPTLNNANRGNMALKYSLSGHKDNVFAVLFSPNRRYLLSTGKDKKGILWDLNNNGKAIKNFDLHENTVIKSIFDSQGKFIITVGKDKLIKIWDFEEMIDFPQAKPRMIFVKHTDWIFGIDISSDDKYLVSSDKTASILLWDFKIRRQIFSFKGGKGMVHTVIFTPDGDNVVAGDQGGNIKIWKMDRGSWRKNYEQAIFNIKAHEGPIWDLAMTEDQKILLSIGLDGNIKFWDFLAKKLVGDIDTSNGAAINPNLSVAISKNGKYFLVGKSDGNILVGSIESQKILKTVKAHNGKVLDVIFSKDSRLAASSGTDKTVKVWDFTFR